VVGKTKNVPCKKEKVGGWTNSTSRASKTAKPCYNEVALDVQQAFVNEKNWRKKRKADRARHDEQKRPEKKKKRKDRPLDRAQKDLKEQQLQQHWGTADTLKKEP